MLFSAPDSIKSQFFMEVREAHDAGLEEALAALAMGRYEQLSPVARQELTEVLESLLVTESVKGSGPSPRIPVERAGLLLKRARGVGDPPGRAAALAALAYFSETVTEAREIAIGAIRGPDRRLAWAGLKVLGTTRTGRGSGEPNGRLSGVEARAVERYIDNRRDEALTKQALITLISCRVQDPVIRATIQEKLVGILEEDDALDRSSYSGELATGVLRSQGELPGPLQRRLLRLRPPYGEGTTYLTDSFHDLPIAPTLAEEIRSWARGEGLPTPNELEYAIRIHSRVKLTPEELGGLVVRALASPEERVHLSNLINLLRWNASTPAAVAELVKRVKKSGNEFLLHDAKRAWPERFPP